MSNKKLSEVGLQNLLDEHAEQLLEGRTEIDTLLERYGVKNDEEIRALLNLASQVYHAMPDAEPSEIYIATLYARLMGDESYRLILWLKQLPRHMQFAAGLGGLTITAGFFWIAAKARREAMEYISSLRGDHADDGMGESALA